MAAAACERDPEPRAPPENGFVSADQHALLSRVDGCVLPFLGGFGAFQKRLVALTWIPALFIGFSQFSDYFLLAQPDSTCVDATGNGTLSWAPRALPQDINNSSGGGGNGSTGSLALLNRTALEALQCACTRWTYELHTGLEQNVVTKWNLVCDSAWKVHIAKFSLLVGSIFGYLVLGVLADWFGRHLVLIISVFFTLVFGMTVAFSVDVTMFSTLRFFEGFFLAGITLSLYVLRIELCLPGWRFSMTMVANFVMLAGQLLMPGLAAVCRDWQILQAVIICPLLLMLTYIWLFPESLRWLLATQQYCRAKWIVERIAKTNKANLDSDELLSELHKSQPKKPKKTCIVKMVGTRNLWKNIVVLCVNSLTGYGIHHCFARSMMDTDVEEITMFHNFYADYYTMAGIAVASCMALCPAVGLMGRRGGLLMFMIITALASLLQLGLLNLLGKYSVQLNIERSDTLKSNFSVAFSIIGMFSSHAVSNLSIFFCAEITPTVIRGGGLGLVLASAGFGMLTAPIMELHNQKGYFLHHVIFACCTLICIICILLLPETRHQPLPETLADGESYTRQPLLPPRKPAEQRHLLPRAQSREYAQVTDTPLHAAAATAVSTMESTASSAVDLTMPPDGEPDSMPLCLMKLQKETQPAEGALLTVVPHTSTPLSASPTHPSTNESLPDLIANVPPQDSAAASETPPSLLSVHTLSHTPPSTISPLTADAPETPSPSPAESPSPSAQPAETPSPPPPPVGHSPSQTPEITPFILHTTGTPPPPRISPIPPSASSSQPVTDSIVHGAVRDLPPPDISQTDDHLSDSVDIPAEGAVDSYTLELPAPLLPPTVDPAANVINNIVPPPPSDSPVYLVNELDSLCSAPSSLHVLQPVPPPSSSSPIDSDAVLLSPSILDPTPLEALSPLPEGATILTEDPTVPSAGDPFTMDLTVSSPIDSGLSPAAVFTASSSSSTANEVESS